MMDTVFRLIGLAVSAVSLILLIISVRGMRKDSAASRLAAIGGIISATLMTGIFILVAGVPLNLWLGAPLLGFGFFVGLLEGQFTRLYYREGSLFQKRSAIYFVLWGLAYLLTLLLAQTNSSVLTAGGILAMILGLGIAFGSNLNLLLRQFLIRPAGAAIISPTETALRPEDLPGSKTEIKPASGKPSDLPR